MNTINELIDVPKIFKTISTLKIKTPSMLEGETIPNNLILTYCGMLQLVYKDNKYRINRHYINLGENIKIGKYNIDNFEIVISGDYTFHVFNIFIGMDIYSFDKDGNLINTYDLRKKGNIAMTKSNGDVYYIPENTIDNTFSNEDNAFLDDKRISWEQSLLAYSHRLDGRICFYIRTNKPINYPVKNIFL